jgi:NADPH-dependent curcumin reductase CurA
MSDLTDDRQRYLWVTVNLRPSYVPPVQVGAEMRGGTVNEVVASRSTEHKVGDVVSDATIDGGWSEFAIIEAEASHTHLGLPWVTLGYSTLGERLICQGEATLVWKTIRDLL